MYQKLQKSTVEHKTIWQCESSLASSYGYSRYVAVAGWARSGSGSAAGMLFNAPIASCMAVASRFCRFRGMNEWIR